jgi:Niemann-Pick C1 protein
LDIIIIKIFKNNNIFLFVIKKSIGYFCATYPFTVIGLSLLTCGLMMFGFYYFSVITDPVELWSPVDSETRLNKNYYDTHFRPFYRTTQLIIRPTNTTPWMHQLPYDTDPRQYSSALDLQFLHQVLDLQNKISSLTGTVYCNSNRTICNDKSKPNFDVPFKVVLKDACFAPLIPDNNNCTIQSVLNYWQNDPANLDLTSIDDFGVVTGDFITHFTNCISAPTTTNDTLSLSW